MSKGIDPDDRTLSMPTITGNDQVGYYASYPEPRGNVWGSQVGGSHYKDFVIQPTEYIIKNGLPFVEGNIVKYVTRYRKKNGLEDLYKARHYLDILIDSLEKGVNGQ